MVDPKCKHNSLLETSREVTQRLKELLSECGLGRGVAGTVPEAQDDQSKTRESRFCKNGWLVGYGIVTVPQW